MPTTYVTSSNKVLVACVNCGRGVEKKLAVDGLCSRCRLCEQCSVRTWSNETDRRCSVCRCKHCGSIKKLQWPSTEEFVDQQWRDPNFTDPAYECTPCIKKLYPDRLCAVCINNMATVTTDIKMKKPLLCGNCLTNDLRCAFCDGKYHDLNKNYTCCVEHRAVRTCKAKECNPGRQCKKCYAQRKQIAELDAAKKKLDYHKYGIHEGETMRQCSQSCEACNYIYENNGSLFTQEPYFWEAKNINERRINRSPRLLAAEIEVCGLARPELKKQIFHVVRELGGSIVRDGSLPPTGFEITTPPAGGDHFIRVTNKICAALFDAGAYVTNKAGLHIHADGRDHSYSDIEKFLLLYSKIEEALLLTQPASRIFYKDHDHPKGFAAPCGKDFTKALDKPLGPKEMRKQLIANIYQPDTLRPPRKTHRDPSRYHGVNVHSWFYRKTLENRLHTGTTVARKIQAWATTWAAIIDTAYAMTKKDIADLNDPIETLLNIAPSDEAHDYLRSRINTYKSTYQNGRAIA